MTKTQAIYDCRQEKFGIDFTVDPIWCAWFSGFVAGEACFSINVRRNHGASYSPTLSIGLRKDDLAILREIQSTLHCGKVYPHHDRAYQFVVNRFFDVLHILVPVFDLYPIRNKKQSDYNIWRRAVMAVRDRYHLNGQAAQLDTLISDLRANRSFQTLEPMSQND